ncbi:uncharacterized protein [Henckelia pumila]|uniref:uncharacterized protein n=1 Tax=Henckelia pumila TaxID=405737 RepID=UPI003C6DFB35
MKRIFLEKYFPASRAANIRKEIYGIKQYTGESLHEYWERNMLDAASGGVFVDKTPVQARNLIENMAANSQQFGTVRSNPKPGRNIEVNVYSLEQQLIYLTSLVRQMAVGNGQNMKVCGICTARGHATVMCPTLQEGSAEQFNAAGGFPEPPQRKYDPYSNTYNPSWKDHPNLRYGNPQETRANIQQLNTQMGQLETAVNRLEALNSNSLPSQTVVNPRENVSAITLRSGKELKVSEEVVKEPVQNKDEQESKVEEDDTIQEEPRGKFPPFSEYKHVAPSPLELKECRKNYGIKGLYEVFRRCEIGDVQLDTAMLDLGASINVMPYSVYASLKLGPSTETGIVIQIADKSTIFPRGVLEDVLVQVENLVFPANFYVLDMKNNDLNSPILLERPFLNTSKSVIDVNNGTLTMEFDREVVKFHIFDTLQIPDYESVINNLDVTNHLSQEHKNVASKKSKKKKKRPKLSTKLCKWVKVDKGIRYEPP